MSGVRGRGVRKWKRGEGKGVCVRGKEVEESRRYARV